jgi:hypothetical protein
VNVCMHLCDTHIQYSLRVCMHAYCMHDVVCTHSHVCMHAYICIYICIHMYIYVYAYICIYICIHMYIHMYAHDHDRITLAQACMHTYVYHSHKHAHTYMYIGHVYRTKCRILPPDKLVYIHIHTYIHTCI